MKARVGLFVGGVLLIAGFVLAIASHRSAMRPSAPGQTAASDQTQESPQSFAGLNPQEQSPKAAAAAARVAAAQFSERYESVPGFSFGYPDSLKIGSIQDPNSGELTVTAQNAGEHIGFQVYVSPDRGAPVTQAEIVQDLPQINAHSFTPVSLDGAPGIAFAATDANFGDSLQVWLVHGGYLYQISTYGNQGALLSKVLGTWKWEALENRM